MQQGFTNLFTPVPDRPSLLYIEDNDILDTKATVTWKTGMISTDDHISHQELVRYSGNDKIKQGRPKKIERTIEDWKCDERYKSSIKFEEIGNLEQATFQGYV